MSNAAQPSKPVSPLSPERLDWNLLRTFMFVVQERGISRAATALHLSQPAVSQALKRLEDAVGGTLLYRRNGEFRLTGLGEALYGIARDMYGMVARIDEAAAQDEGEIAGTLRLMLISKIQSAAYDEFLMQFHRRYPKIEFYVDVMQSTFILDALSKRIPALGICLCRKAIDSLERRIFMRHRYVMVCGRNHPLFSRRNIQVEDLLDQSFVSFASDQLGDTLSPLTIFRDQQGFTGRIVGTSPYVEEIRRMVIAGMGLSCLPEHMIRQDILAGDLKRVLPDDVMAEIDVFLTWHKQRKLSLAEQTFLGALERFLERTPIEMRGG
ncbi:transcriptional regulator [Bordetella ansorpii]|uniref:Transcriptional regulator n=1 Tax=Bordetella ansorpii TaxID=288768 RepID=A0A157SUM6_9BORD|nr:LysR family transcriptional regulator [Bordetella ansorpii]SAI74149.1 transcriptional regulator [Bordetella ansorpii]